jgi:hypothetical protein
MQGRREASRLLCSSIPELHVIRTFLWRDAAIIE